MIPRELTDAGWREAFRSGDLVLVEHDDFPRGEFDPTWALAYVRAQRAVAL